MALRTCDMYDHVPAGTPFNTHVNMVSLVAAVVGCFWWFMDVVLCFMVSSSVIVAVGAGLVFFYKYFEPAARQDKAIKELVYSYGKLGYKRRVLMVTSPVVIFLSAVLWRVWDIVINDSVVKYDHLQDGVFLSNILPTWFIPFWFVSDYEMHLAVLPLRLTKLLFISAFVLSIPLLVVAVHFVSQADKPVLKLALWLIRMYHKWASVDCTEHIHRILDLEFTEDQYMKTILKVTLACLEKEKEVEQLEDKIEQLQGNIVEVNQWVQSERRLANNFDRKNRDIERRLQSERRRSQSFESKCKDLERKLENERRTVTALEKKYREQQKRAEKRTVVVKQQLSGDDGMCVICMERKRQFLLRPCNHFCVCNTCKSTLQNKCPLCRKLIQNYEKIFIS